LPGGPGRKGQRTVAGRTCCRSSSTEADRLANLLQQQRQDALLSGHDIRLAAHAELDPAVFKKADVLIAHYTAGRPAVIDSSRGVTHADETEDMRKAVRAALKEHELPNLHDLVLGRTEGRTTPEQVSCFLNYVGLGYQFAAVGSLLHRKALELRIGRELPTDWFTEDVNP